MTPSVRCAVVGAGGFAETCHIPGLQSHPDAVVTVLCGRNADRCRAMAERHGIPHAVTDYREAVLRDDVDALAIVTPNVSHRPIALAALEAGKHVFCEKPLAIDAAEAREMETAAVKAGRVHQVAFTFRFLHGIEAFRSAVRAGAVGRPVYARVRFEWGGDLGKNSRIGWRHRSADSGRGGILQDMGSHCIDLINYAVEPIDELVAHLVTVRRTREDARTREPSEVDTDDMARAYWRAASGLQGEWATSRISSAAGDNNRLELIGEEGSLQVALSRGHSDEVQLLRASAEPETLPLPDEPGKGTDYALGRMMRAFVDAILGRPPIGPEATFAHGRQAQEGIDAALRSFDERRWVRLAEI